jgi:hypothetical protein
MKKFLPLAAVLLFWVTTAMGSNPALFSALYAPGNFLFAEDPDQPERKIEIYPNPVTEGRLTITSSEDILSVQILNIAGKTVFSQDYEPNTTSVVVEPDNLEKGIYLVRIGFANKISHTEKIMVK